jgi:DNA repair protein SbcD/Mre11
MLTILHFADAHIDMAGQGRHDPETGLPLRVLDFLKALDTIVDAAINEKVDLVIFAGDAYKDRTPVPTFQREWGRRIMRLSHAGIPTLLLVGNHDLSPASGRAHALQEFETLEIPFIHVASKPTFYATGELDNLPVQVLALPWVSRSGLMAALELSGAEPEKVFSELGARLSELVQKWLEKADPTIPTLLTAHASVQGAVYGGERAIMLGSDLVLPGGLVRDPRLDYVALGHIHKPQNLNEGLQPPVIYPGSIERVDFGEAADDKFFIIAHVERGHTEVEWRKLNGRRFIDRFARLNPDTVPVTDGLPTLEDCMQALRAALPQPGEIAASMLRLTVEYPRGWEAFIDEAALRSYCQEAFEFHLVRRPQVESRLRLPGDQTISSLNPLELLDLYWKSANTSPETTTELSRLAQEIILGGQTPTE